MSAAGRPKHELHRSAKREGNPLRAPREARYPKGRRLAIGRGRQRTASPDTTAQGGR